MVQDHMDTGGDCGRLLASVDWSMHQLGPREDWRPELTSILQIVMDARIPMFMLWGPEQIILYNDACAALYGSQHPHTFARPFKETLGDLWPQVEPDVSRVYAGVSVARSDVEMTFYCHGSPEIAYISFSYTPVRLSSGAVAGMFCTLTETTRTMAPMRQRRQLNSIFETALGSVAVMSGPTHIITYRNAEFDALTGHRDLIGRPVVEAFPEIRDQGVPELIDEVFETGVAYTGRGASTLLQRRPDAPLEERVVDFLFHPIFGPDQTVEGIFVQAIDVTDCFQLSRELGHRLKNQLAIVLSLMNQSFRGATDLAQVRSILEGRISALARAHDAALSGDKLGATIEGVIGSAIEWHNTERVSLKGPQIPIAERQALSLALIVHELLTNAIKYGALANDVGRVDVSWSLAGREDDPRLTIVWKESGGPRVSEPSHNGSGARLIKAGLSGARNASIDLSFAPEGLQCVITTDLPGVSGAFPVAPGPAV